MDDEWERQAQHALQQALAGLDRDSSTPSAGNRTPDSLRTDCTLPDMGDDGNGKKQPNNEQQGASKSSACIIL